MSKELVAFLVFLAIYVPVLWIQWKNEDEMGEECINKVEPEKKPEQLVCAFCGEKTKLVHDFGKVALAGGFLKPEQFKDEKKYPLRLCYCESCHAVQLADKVDPDVMFRDYFYFSSANETIKRHFREYAKEVVERFNPRTAIEVGCNDGVLLSPLRSLGVVVTGVDPSTTVPKGPHIVNDYFTPKVAKSIGKVDMVIANNVFAHISDIHTATRAVIEALDEHGVFVMEVHYLGDMIDGVQYDWIYHEHLYYYSLISLERHLKNYGLRVFDVKKVKTHGGSMRYYACMDDRDELPSVGELRRKEAGKLDRVGTFYRFSRGIVEHCEQLKKTLEGKKVVGYGASGRANAMIQYCGLDIAYMVDDAPAKHGYFTPASHIEIFPSDKLRDEKDAVILAFAWGYLEELQSRWNLPMTVPFPSIRVIENRKAA